jgi:hypothetical protein
MRRSGNPGVEQLLLALCEYTGLERKSQENIDRAKELA